MATKSYTKHKEFKEFSSSSRGSTPYASEQFDMLKSELIPKGSKLETIGSGAHGTREYQYEYKEEKLPSGGKYDRKDLRTVEEFTIPPRSSPKAESSYFYEREEKEIPIKTSGSRSYNYESSISSTPGYSKVKSSKVTKDLSKNVQELDSLLDDLQKDQERQLYKSKLDGYTSDTAESINYDYKKNTLGKAPSSGYSTLKHEERVETSSWASPPPPKTSSTLRQELYREEKTESRVVPTQVQVTTVPAPAPVCSSCHHHLSSSTMSRSSTPMNKVTTTVKTYTYEVPADQDPTTVPLPPLADHQQTYVSSAENIRSINNVGGPPATCQYCSNCSNRIGEVTSRSFLTSTDEHRSERVLYPAPANTVTPLEPLNQNGHGPYGPSSYKYTETSYSSHNTTERFPGASRPASPPAQSPPKHLDDLMADFPEAKFPTETDGVVQRKVQVTHEKTESKSGPAVYYPPGHTPFAKKEASMAQAGGAYASGKGMYEYESGSKSKEKHSEKKTAVPVCLPLCCAMPCVIM